MISTTVPVLYVHIVPAVGLRLIYLISIECWLAYWLGWHSGAVGGEGWRESECVTPCTPYILCALLSRA